tara:strand:+ start:18 stop:851 length:834 start_codon:yes stop_codon:yes gene_type:complete
MSSKYNFIDPENIINLYDSKFDEWLNSIDLAIIFDIGDYRRLKEIFPLIKSCKNKINIDHHESRNESFFSFEYIDLKAPATGYMVWEYLNKYNTSSLNDIKVANALYAAIITDTGSFRYSNTNPKTHQIASQLLSAGVIPNQIYQNVYENKTYGQIKLLSLVINKLKYECNKKVCYVVISKEYLEQCNANLSDTDGLSEFLRSIKGVEVSFVLTELKTDYYKMNLRSRGKYIINDIAEKFEGGGHPLASGAKIKTVDFDKVISKIVNELNNRILNGN